MARNFSNRRSRSWQSITGTPDQRASRALSRLEDVTRLVSEWVWEIDTNGTFTFISERIFNVLELHPMTLIGKRFSDIGQFINDDGTDSTPDFEKPFRDVTFLLTDSQGTQRTLLISGLPIYERETWQYEGACGTVEDISERLKIQQELREARDAAETASQSKSTFLASMSHELRTPLNAILGFTDLMRNRVYGPLGNDRYEGYVQDIHSAGQHLLRMINEILDLSRIEAGKTEFDMVNFNPMRDLDDVVTLLGPLCRAQNITINLQSCDDCNIYGDRFRFRQIMINLITNAIKYNKPNGTVDISWQAEADNLVHFTVCDSGLGISQDHLIGLFEPFTRYRNSEHQIEGSGVGLAIARRLVELMGGSIGVNSELEQGSTFWVALPKARP